MLWGLFFLAVSILASAWLKRPTALWHRAVTWIAAFLLIAVLVALGIEAMMQAPVA